MEILFLLWKSNILCQVWTKPDTLMHAEAPMKAFQGWSLQQDPELTAFNASKWQLLVLILSISELTTFSGAHLFKHQAQDGHSKHNLCLQQQL